MPIAAHTTGGPSTPHLLLGLVVLLLALAGAGTLLRVATRLAGQTRRGLGNRKRSAPGRPRDRTHTTAPTTPDPTAAPAAPRPTAHQPRHATSADDGSALRAPNPDASATGKPSVRRSPETLEPLADSLRSAQLRMIAEAHVAETLAALPTDRWYVGRYVLMDGHRIPFVILGETGAFAVWALTGPPVWDELPFPSEMADRMKGKLPGYTGPVQVGLCRALGPTARIAPRWWCRPGEPGAWVMGREWLTRWIEHFGPQHAFAAGDIQRLRALADRRRDGPPPRVPDVVPDID
ncbi:MAG TPA: hypothetical protein VEF89_29120 [Solirubrobacteraceae bacterium]|nr:hypothetical protein [Solirubrobacteraceae bacterium]